MLVCFCVRQPLAEHVRKTMSNVLHRVCERVLSNHRAMRAPKLTSQQPLGQARKAHIGCQLQCPGIQMKLACQIVFDVMQTSSSILCVFGPHVDNRSMEKRTPVLIREPGS